MADNVTSIGGISQAGAEKLHEMADNSKGFEEYLRFHGRMFKHSPSVTLEFFAQRPESRFIGTQAQWERAGYSIALDSSGLRFRDSNGAVAELYDFSQCVNQTKLPPQWEMSQSAEIAVREKLGLAADRNLLNALTDTVVTDEAVNYAIQRLGTEIDRSTFKFSFRSAVSAMIAGRLEVGGNISFAIQVDQSAMSRMDDAQRLGFITMAAVSARNVLNQVEQVMNQRRAETQAERSVQNEVRGFSESNSRGNGEGYGQRTAGSTEGTASQLSDAVQSNAEGRSAGLGSDTGSGWEDRHTVSALAEKPSDRERDVLVSGESDNRNIRNEDGTGRTVNEGETDRELRSEMDGLDGEESSGQSRVDAIPAQLSDGGTVGRQESVGVSEPAGRSVPESESTSSRVREDSGMGKDEGILHGQRNDEGRNTSRSDNAVNDKISQIFAQTEEPSTEQEKPITSERRAEILADFSKKHHLESLSVFVMKNKGYHGDGRAYDLMIKDGKRVELREQVFALDKGARFTEAVLQSGLAELEQSEQFQEFLSFRTGHTLFDEAEAETEKVDTSVNSEQEKSLDEQIRMSLNGQLSEYDSIKLSDTPDILLSVGCTQLPMLYSQKHLRDALTPKSPDNPHYHGLTVSQIEAVPEQLTEPAIIFDSLSPHNPNSIICVLDMYDNDQAPIVVSITPNGKGMYQLQMVDSNYATSIYGKDHGFENMIERAANSGRILYWDKNKSQAIFSSLRLQLPQALNSLDSNTIIHQSSAIVNRVLHDSDIQAEAETEKVDTSVNSEPKVAPKRTFTEEKQAQGLSPEEIAESLSIRQNELDRTISMLQKRLSRPELSQEQREELQESLEFFQSADADHIEFTAEALEEFRAKKAQERAAAERIPLLRGELGIGSGFESGKQRIAAYIAENEPNDAELAVFLKNEYGIGGHSGPDEPDVSYNSKGMQITTADHQREYSYKWTEVASEIRGLLERNEYLDVESQSDSDSIWSPVLETEDENGRFSSYSTKVDGKFYWISKNQEGYYDIETQFGDGSIRPVSADWSNFGSRHSAEAAFEEWLDEREEQKQESNYTYAIYQLKSGEEHHYHRFEGLESNKYAHLTHEDYDLVYSGDMNEIGGDSVDVKLEQLYRIFNANHPADFKGHSLSVSDVVVVTEDNIQTPYYVDIVGYSEMPEFLANKSDLIDISFTGNPDGFNAIKVAARTDSFVDTGSTNMWGFDIWYARLSEKAVLADIQKVIQTAQENGCYLNASSVDYLTERFGSDFMPEQEVDLKFQIPTTDMTIDFATVKSFTLTDSYSQYEGGIDSNGHERKDNFSSQSRSCTYTYRGHGIAVSEAISPDRDYPVIETYNIYNPVDRAAFQADIEEYANDSEDLRVDVEHNTEEVLSTSDNPPEISTIHFGMFGNGVTAYDVSRTDPETNDYPIVAHISVEGVIDRLDENLSDTDKARISEQAQSVRAEFTEKWNAMPDTEKLLTIMQTANPSQVSQILSDKLPADQIIAKYENAIIFRTDDFPTNEQKEAAELTEPVTVDSLKQHYLNRDTNRQMDSYEIAGMVLNDNEGMTISAQAFFDRYHASKYSPIQAAEIRGYIAEALKNSPSVEAESDTAEPDSDTISFQNADLAKFLADRTLSSDEWEDMAYPLYDNGYLDKHQPSEKGTFGYHLSATALYDLARRFHEGEDIRHELALGLLAHNASERIEFCFEDGIISDRTFYHPESERHTLETVRTDTGFNCYFNGTERTVSFEEIGQAFLDHIHDEFNDLAFWWARDDLHETFPDMTDEQMRNLISVFDKELTPNWENADYAPIKQALTDVLGNTEQAEKAFAIIAENKYHVVEELKKSDNLMQTEDDQPPITEDGKPLSNLITFVRETNQKMVENLAVGDIVGLQGITYKVANINGDFMISMNRVNEDGTPFEDAGTAGHDFIGNWKSSLVAEAGDTPLTVIKAEAARQIDELNARHQTKNPILSQEESDKQKQNSVEHTEFINEFHALLSGDQAVASRPLVVGATPNVMTICGANGKLNLTITKSVIDKAMRPEIRDENGRLTGKTGHGLTEQQILDALQNIRNPIMVLQGGHENSLLIITEIQDDQGRNIMIPVDLSKDSATCEVNAIRSTYGRDNLQSFLDKAFADGRVLAVDMKKADEMNLSNGKWYPKAISFICYDNSIAYSLNNVKYPDQEKSLSESDTEQSITPEHTEPELAVGDHLIYKDKEYEVESIDMDSFITLKDTTLENAPRLVSRVSFVAKDFINSGDFQKVDTSVKSDEFHERAVPTQESEVSRSEKPIPDEPAKRRGRLTRPEELYKLLSEMYPQMISGEHTHEHYEADPDTGYEPLSVEMIGDDLYSFMTYYIQEGDLMRDPDITFMLDHDEKTAHVFSFQQDGVPPYGTYYVEVADENGHVDTKLQASLEETFLQNLKNAQYADRILTRFHDKLGQEVEIVPDTEEAPAKIEETTEPAITDECAHIRKELNAFSEEYGLGELNLRFMQGNQVGIYEKYADSSERLLGDHYYWDDSDLIQPETCKKILEDFANTSKRRYGTVSAAGGRNYSVESKGKSELPPVPEHLPEIVYAASPMQKARENIEAIRELHRLARCEANGQPLYDKKRNQWNCKENSDERLRKYSGWGGLQQLFDANSGRYKGMREQLQNLLTQEEYESAKASTTDAHYTPQIVIDAMYQAVRSMGLSSDSRVLEPACGTGNFITRMPHSIGNAGVVGVELDDITAQIAARLNADNKKVTIMHSAFERSGQEDNSFDLVIGNVPFGDYKMNDPDYTKDWLIHDAFFRKALDKVAAGGVVAFVTSSGTLDKKNAKVREYLAEKAELIGAIRLPNTAFADAGTGVTSDIIFLQKRQEPLSPDAPKPDWCYVAQISEDDPDMRINSYFVQNPQMMLGTMRKTSHFDRLTCDPIEGADLKTQLNDAVRQLKAKITVTKREKAAQERRGYIQPWGKEYTYQEKEGKLYYNEGKTMREVTGSAADQDRLKRLIELRTLTRQLIDKQKTAVHDETLVPLRQALNQQYDEFTSKYGQLNSDAVKKAFGADADFSLLRSLEDYDDESRTYSKAEIFEKRTVNPVIEITAVDTLEEAYQVSLDKRGKPNIPYMATLLQAQYPDMEFPALTQQIQQELLEKGMVFIDPRKEVPDRAFSGIVERADYLSGNVRMKLADAQTRAATDPAFQRNVDALMEIIPEDIHAEEITVRMGCPWIDAEDYSRFLCQLAGRSWNDARCEVLHSSVTGEFDIMQAGSRKDINVKESTTYGTEALTMYEIAQKLLNQRPVKVTKTVPSPKDPSKTTTRTDPVETKKAMEKAKLIEEAFEKWIFESPERKEKYERRYNDLFNSLVGRKYDGSHLTFDGQSADFELRPHQKNCIARAVYGGNTLAAHVVGAGKSAVFQSAVMKKKQLGLINKACVVVPKALVEQTEREWRKLYPDAKLLTMSPTDLSSEEKRDLFAARVATGDYDAVIVSVEQFEKMPMSKEFQQRYLQQQLSDLEDTLSEVRAENGNRKDASTKQIEAAKKKLARRLDEVMNPKTKQRGKDILLNFEQLGFDYLVVDEAHNYKNGFVQTKMGNVSGVSVNASGRAQDMQMKCDYFHEQYDQGHLLFCTGTPVSNSMTELYVMTRYLRPDLLADANVAMFDDWAATFGKVTTQYKQTATGELKLKTAFAKFANLPEVMMMYKEFADIQSAKKLDLPRPKLKTGKPQIVSVPASPEQEKYIRSLVDRARIISEGNIDPSQDNMLVVTSESRITGLCNEAVAALMRKHGMEVPEDFVDSKNSKVDACIEKALEVYKETTEQKGAQIIFSDVAVNGDKGNFSVYAYIREQLIAKGIPKEEIVFAPKSDAKNREDIFRDINSGKYRIVLASTSTLGTGANVQERLAAVHHVDIPWKPSDFEQREGRILRQGNTFDEVQIFNYITEGTMDSYLYQVVTDKARYIAQLYDDENPVRVMEDCDDKVLTFGEMQAQAEGNPDFKLRIELGMKVTELQFAKAEYQRETGELRAKVEEIPEQIELLRTRIEGITKDIAKVDSMRNEEGKVSSLTLVTAKGQTLTKREDINDYLMKVLHQKQKNPFDDAPAFKIGDFNVEVQMDGSQQKFAFVVNGESPVAYRQAAEIGEHSDNAQRLMNLFGNVIPSENEKCEFKIEKLTIDKQQAEERLAEPFPHEEDLLKAQKDLDEVEARLLGITEMEAVILDPDEEPIEQITEQEGNAQTDHDSDQDTDTNGDRYTPPSYPTM